ncbi:MAG: hypothetical protein ACOCTK_00715 [Candidatus Saliniplasma sp.]
MIDIGFLLAGFTSLLIDFSIAQYTTPVGAIAGIQTSYVILGIVLIIVFSVFYAVKRAIRRGVRRKVYDTVTQKATSSQRQPMPPQKPCPDCEQSMRFVSQHDRWYCDNCKDYK